MQLKYCAATCNLRFIKVFQKYIHESAVSPTCDGPVVVGSSRGAELHTAGVVGQRLAVVTGTEGLQEVEGGEREHTVAALSQAVAQ